MQQIGPNVKALAGVLAQSQGVGTVNGPAIDTFGFSEAIVIVNAGTFTTGTADIKVQESVDSAFTSPLDITGAAFTQITSANDDQVYKGVVKLRADRKKWIRVVSVVATAACLLSASVLLGKGESLIAQAPSFDV